MKRMSRFNFTELLLLSYMSDIKVGGLRVDLPWGFSIGSYVT